MADLSLVSTNDLLTELRGRFANSLFIGQRTRTASDEDILWDWLGERYALMGLVARMAYRLQIDTDDSAQDVKDA